MTGGSTISPENNPPKEKPVRGGASPALPLYLALSGTVACIFILRIIFRDKHILSIIIVLLLAGCFYAPLVYFLAVKKVRMPTPVFIAVLIASAVLRFIFIGSEPAVLSDDVYRYLWDGKVQTEGVNPYRYPPANRELSHLRDKEIYPQDQPQEVSHLLPAGKSIYLQGGVHVRRRQFYSPPAVLPLI